MLHNSNLALAGISTSLLFTQPLFAQHYIIYGYFLLYLETSNCGSCCLTWKSPWWWMTPSWSRSMDSSEYSVWMSILPCLSSGSSSLRSSFNVRICHHATDHNLHTYTRRQQRRGFKNVGAGEKNDW